MSMMSLRSSDAPAAVASTPPKASGFLQNLGAAFRHVADSLSPSPRPTPATSASDFASAASNPASPLPPCLPSPVTSASDFASAAPFPPPLPSPAVIRPTHLSPLRAIQRSQLGPRNGAKKKAPISLRTLAVPRVIAPAAPGPPPAAPMRIPAAPILPPAAPVTELSQTLACLIKVTEAQSATNTAQAAMVDRLFLSQRDEREATAVRFQQQQLLHTPATPASSSNQRKALALATLADDPSKTQATWGYQRPGTSGLLTFTTDLLCDLVHYALVNQLHPEFNLSLSPSQLLSACLLEFSTISIEIFHPSPIKSVSDLRAALHRLRAVFLITYGTILSQAVDALAASVETLAPFHPLLKIPTLILLVNARLDHLRLHAPTFGPLADNPFIVTSARVAATPESAHAFTARFSAIERALTIRHDAPEVLAQNNAALERGLLALQLQALSTASNSRKPAAKTSVPRRDQPGPTRGKSSASTAAAPSHPPATAGAVVRRTPPIDWSTFPSAYVGEKPCFNWACGRGTCANTLSCQQQRPHPHTYTAGTTPAVTASVVAWIRALPAP